MESSSKKIYGIDHVDAKIHLETLFSSHAPHSTYRESTTNLIRVIYKAFSTGKITGRTAINFLIGPIIAPLLPMKDFIQEMTVVEVADDCLKELERWKNKDQRAFDWCHATEYYQDLKESSEELEDEEEDLRRKIKNILKWDLCKENPEDSLQLPTVDIVSSIWFLETTSKDQEDYRRKFRKLTYFIKPGGYFLMYACTNASYFSTGGNKFKFLYCDESFYKKVISEGGFEIKHVVSFDREMRGDTVDHGGIVFITAQKLKEPENRETSKP